MEIDVATRQLIKLALLPPGILLILLLFGWSLAGRWFGRMVLLLTIALMYQIAAQLPPQYRGVFSDVDAYRTSDKYQRLIAPVGFEISPEN